jgi:hypothetical protein
VLSGPIILAVSAAVAVALVLGHGAAVLAAPALQGCSGNLLQNPGFDGGSHKTQSLGTSLSSAVADGWTPWFVRGNENVNREPEFKVEQVAIGGDPARVRSGGQSQKWFTTWATHTAGIYQRVNVAPGTRLQFTAYGMAYTGEADIFDGERKTFVSDRAKPGNYWMSVGIEPSGALPANMGAAPPDSVVWSERTMTMDEWVPMTVSGVARGSAVTVYLKGQPDWGVKHNDSFWEDTCLVAVGRGPAEAAVDAVATSVPGGSTTAAESVPTEPGTQAAAPAPAATALESAGASGPGGAIGPDATALPMRAAAPAPEPLPAVPGKFWAVRQ